MKKAHIKQAVLNLKEDILGRRVCWVRNKECWKVSVLVFVSAVSTDKLDLMKMTEKTEKIAAREARKVGRVASVGVCMQGNELVGIAELDWTPEIEKKLVTAKLLKAV